MQKNPDTSEEGLERLRAAVQANPRSTTFVALAHRLCEAGRAAEAEDVCREGLGRHPGLVTGQVALGRALLDRGRLREALEVLIGAAKANPDHGDAFRWLGEAVIKRGDMPRARALLEYAEELSPNDRRVTELLIEAGGTPSFRSPRPKTDFEHTRISNARALADRMHEVPGDDFRPGSGPHEMPDAGSHPGGAGLGIDEPTVVDGRAALQAWRSVATHGGGAEASSGPFGPDSDRILPPRVGELQAAPAPLPAAGGAPEPLVQVVNQLNHQLEADSDTTPVTLRPHPGATMTAALPAGRARFSRRTLAMGGGLAGLLIVGATVFIITRGHGGALEAQRKEMAAAVARGTLDSLTSARTLGRQIVGTAADDGDTLASLAYVNTLLTRDYGLPLRPEAEEDLARARTAKGATAARHGTIHATCALLALGAGRLVDAQQCAEQAVAATPDGAPALLAAARVKIHGADLDGARRDLERLLARTPDYAEAVLDWAAIWIDMGDPSTASQSLREQVKRSSDHLRARLLLAEAERALGDRSGAEGLEAGCRAQSPRSPAIRAGCLVAAAAQSRMAGEHQLAVRSARAAAVTLPDEPRLLAQVAVALAVLGDVDVADEALQRARRLARETAVPLAWADMAVRLGRKQVVVPGHLLANAAGPERRLVAARVVLAYEGPGGLAKALKGVPRGLVLLDSDLRALAQLAEESAGARTDHAELGRRADKGDPVAAYVLGRLLEKSDPRQAARRLEKALWGHGDACEAAQLYRTLGRQLDAASPSLRTLRELRSRNAQCPAAQI